MKHSIPYVIDNLDNLKNFHKKMKIFLDNIKPKKCLIKKINTSFFKNNQKIDELHILNMKITNFLCDVQLYINILDFAISTNCWDVIYSIDIKSIVRLDEEFINLLHIDFKYLII